MCMSFLEQLTLKYRVMLMSYPESRNDEGLYIPLAQGIFLSTLIEALEEIASDQFLHHFR